MDRMNQYIETLKNGKGFEWIAQHGHLLNKYELIDIIKELDYAIEHMSLISEPEDIYKAAAEELNDMYNYDEEEE